MILRLTTTLLLLTTASTAFADDAKSILGEWKATKVMRDGKDVTNEAPGGAVPHFKFEEKKLTVTLPAANRKREFTYKLDAKAKPPQIQFTLVGDELPKRLQGSATGLYELKADGLKLLMPNRPKVETPKTLEAKGKSHTLFVLERVKAKSE